MEAENIAKLEGGDATSDLRVDIGLVHDVPTALGNKIITTPDEKIKNIPNE